jgi:hypothetical protein
VGHEGQVIRHQINEHGYKHEYKGHPEAPIMMRPLPVRTMFVVAALQFFTDVHK